MPPFDNLYLDMNGIIHNCSHGDGDDAGGESLSELQIFTNISDYISTLFDIVKPRRVFYMAVDGCAPRAKMNQQRARRFRAAKDAEEALAKARREVCLLRSVHTRENLNAIQQGKAVKTEGRFDSNCITPGTPFMTRLNEYLKYYVRTNMTSNPAWRNLRVVLSGHDVSSICAR